MDDFDFNVVSWTGVWDEDYETLNSGYAFTAPAGFNDFNFVFLAHFNGARPEAFAEKAGFLLQRFHLRKSLL